MPKQQSICAKTLVFYGSTTTWYKFALVTRRTGIPARIARCSANAFNRGSALVVTFIKTILDTVPRNPAGYRALRRLAALTHANPVITNIGLWAWSRKIAFGRAVISISGINADFKTEGDAILVDFTVDWALGYFGSTFTFAILVANVTIRARSIEPAFLGTLCKSIADIAAILKIIRPTERIVLTFNRALCRLWFTGA